ncbi:hypothetical protein [Motiliproteus coralliicola]|uniref:hypothetical protein n=1 Tax=Motiliproteus coralliicola TaxID=2283196 RepID=UPI00140243CC|nr:hypothetical protein [Motiliproteus coralliicola]
MKLATSLFDDVVVLDFCDRTLPAPRPASTLELLAGACTPEQHNQQWSGRLKDLAQ